MKTLVGQTVRMSPQNKTAGGNTTRQLKILKEFFEDDVRKYQVQDVATKEKFSALAVRYDELFLVKRGEIMEKHSKGKTFYNTSHPDYKKK